MKDLEIGIISIIQNIYHKKNSEEITLSNATSLRSIGFDSFDFAELTVKIEDAFGVDIFEKRIIDTLGEIIEEVTNGSK